MKRRKLAMLLLAAAVAASVLAGCGGGSTEPEQAEETAETEETENVQEESDPAEEGISEADFSRTEGLWLLDGAADTASIYMDGEGCFITYYASGAAEAAGYLEYVDEYGDGNGRYDMYDESGEFLNGFYFDSDTQFHFGNSEEGGTYIREDAAGVTGDSGEDMAPECGVLMNSPGYTGLTPLEVNNDFHGGYYYSDLTEDGLTVIVNTAFANDYGSEAYADETFEEFAGRWADTISQVENSAAEARELAIVEDTEKSAAYTYPVYTLEWLTGENEDTRHWDAMLICTDAYTYMYAFNTQADFAEEMTDVWYETFDNLVLYFPGEEE